MELERDKTLWKIAKKRVAFRRHLLTYVVVNIFLWLTWYLNKDWSSQNSSLPWPVWGTFGWGIAVLFNYYDAFHGQSDFATEREYEKLAKKKNS